MVRLTDRPDMTLDVYGGRKTIRQLKHGTIILPNWAQLFKTNDVVS